MFRGTAFLFKFCWKYNKRYIIYAVAYQIFYALVPLASVVLPKYIIDELTGGKQVKVIAFYVSLLLLINLVGGMCRSFLSWKMFTEKNNVFTKFQEMMAEKLAAADLSQLEDPKFLEIKEKAHKFLYANGQGFGRVLDNTLNIFGKIFMFAGIITIISTLNVAIVLLFVGLVLLNAAFESHVQKVIVQWNIEQAPVERKTFYLLDVIEDAGYGKELRINNLKHWFAGKVRTHLKESAVFYDKQMRATSHAQYFSTALNFLREGVSYGYLAYRVIARHLSIGNFSMYLSAIVQFSSAMNDVMKSIVYIKEFGGYYDALEQYLNIPAHMSEGKNLPAPEKIETIEFRHVGFTYPGQSEPALSDINLSCTMGEKIAIVGENGAGKSTLIKLLSRMYDPTEGAILVNGTDIRDFSCDSYHARIAAVFQDYKMFSFTLKDNIAFANEKGYSDEKVEQILAMSGFGAKEQQLEKGIYANVNRNFEEDGFIPSGGEGQKIAIARALYKDAPVVMLDEPTAALDPRSEYEIYQKFAAMTQDKLAFFITHRLASVHFCTRVLVFKNGRLIGDGTHASLLKTNAEYADLYHMQSQFYENDAS